MARLIDADALLHALPDDLPYKGSVRRVLMQSPTVDAELVMRCKDCKHLRPDCDAYAQEPTGYWCAERDLSGIDTDGFCSYGERWEDTSCE